MNATCEDH